MTTTQPPIYYFDGILYNQNFFNQNNNGASTTDIIIIGDERYLKRTGTAVSLATSTTFEGIVDINGELQTTDITPDDTGIRTLGTSDLTYGSSYIDAVYTTAIQAYPGYTEVIINNDLNFDTNKNIKFLNSLNVRFLDFNPAVGFITSRTPIIPDIDSKYDIGTGLLKFNTIFSNNINANNINTLLIQGTTNTNNLKPQIDNTYSLGTSLLKYVDVHSNNLRTNNILGTTQTNTIQPTDTDIYDLGSTTLFYNNIYVRNINNTPVTTYGRYLENANFIISGPSFDALLTDRTPQIFGSLLFTYADFKNTSYEIEIIGLLSGKIYQVYTFNFSIGVQLFASCAFILPATVAGEAFKLNLIFTNSYFFGIVSNFTILYSEFQFLRRNAIYP